MTTCWVLLVCELQIPTSRCSLRERSIQCCAVLPLTSMSCHAFWRQHKLRCTHYSSRFFIAREHVSTLRLLYHAPQELFGLTSSIASYFHLHARMIHSSRIRYAFLGGLGAALLGLISGDNTCRQQERLIECGSCRCNHVSQGFRRVTSKPLSLGRECAKRHRRPSEDIWPELPCQLEEGVLTFF